MNRENKKKTFEKSYYKTHPCMDTFTCKACGWPVGPEGAGSGHRNHCPNCLTSLHLDVEPGDRAADCGGLRRADGACSGLGAEGRRVGDHPPLQAVRRTVLQ